MQALSSKVIIAFIDIASFTKVNLQRALKEQL